MPSPHETPCPRCGESGADPCRTPGGYVLSTRHRCRDGKRSPSMSIAALRAHVVRLTLELSSMRRQRDRWRELALTRGRHEVTT